MKMLGTMVSWQGGDGDGDGDRDDWRCQLAFVAFLPSCTSANESAAVRCRSPLVSRYVFFLLHLVTNVRWVRRQRDPGLRRRREDGLLLFFGKTCERLEAPGQSRIE